MREKEGGKEGEKEGGKEREGGKEGRREGIHRFSKMAQDVGMV